MSIANYFTLVRLVISPIFLGIYLGQNALHITPHQLPYILFALLGISELSDALDGYIARKYNQVTDLGKVLDPMADSIIRITVFLTFTLEPVELPIYLIFIFLYRDSLISTLRTVCALKGFVLAARQSGKIKAVIQALAGFFVLALMIFHSQSWISTHDLQVASLCVVGLAAAYSVISGLEYIYTYWHFIAKAM